MLALKYRCVECDRKLSWLDPEGEPRLCDYTGLFYCPSCHWNARCVTPARIIHNWDFTPHPVSQAAMQYLYLMYSRPVIHIEKTNAKLLAVVQELNHVHELRKEIISMKRYLTVCRIAAEQKILLLLSDRQHFVDGSEFYSLRDLVDTQSGILCRYLEEKTSALAEHIRSCVLCTAKGFICELCDSSDDSKDLSSRVIFPFDKMTSTCPSCQGVFHKECLKVSPSCPKCERKRQRNQRVANHDKV